MQYRFDDYLTLLHHVSNFNFFDVDCKSIIKKLQKNSNLKKHETWVTVHEGILLSDEDHSDLSVGENLNLEYKAVTGDYYQFKKENDWQLIKFYNQHSDFYLDRLLVDIFGEFNERVSYLTSIEYIHLHSIHNLKINTHTDGNMVLIINICCPKEQDIKDFGLMIGDDFYQPRDKDVLWLDTDIPHSAWNLSNLEWKFLTVSINRKYLY